MTHAVNTFIPDSIGISDRAKRNTGGYDNSNTLIEQGDYPVNVDDLKNRDSYEQEMMSEYPIDAADSDYVARKNCDGDIVEGVSLCRTMHNDTIMKNSDY